MRNKVCANCGHPEYEHSPFGCHVLNCNCDWEDTELYLFEWLMMDKDLYDEGKRA